MNVYGNIKGELYSVVVKEIVYNGICNCMVTNNLKHECTVKKLIARVEATT